MIRDIAAIVATLAIVIGLVACESGPDESWPEWYGDECDLTIAVCLESSVAVGVCVARSGSGWCWPWCDGSPGTSTTCPEGLVPFIYRGDAQTYGYCACVPDETIP